MSKETERCEFARLIAISYVATVFKSVKAEAHELPLKPNPLAPTLGKFPVATMRFPVNPQL